LLSGCLDISTSNIFFALNSCNTCNYFKRFLGFVLFTGVNVANAPLLHSHTNDTPAVLSSSEEPNEDVEVRH